MAEELSPLNGRSFLLPQTAQNDTGNYWAQSTVRLIGERRNALGDNPYFCLNTRQKWLTSANPLCQAIDLI